MFRQKEKTIKEKVYDKNEHFDLAYHFKEFKGELWDEGYKIKKIELVKVDCNEEIVEI